MWRVIFFEKWATLHVILITLLLSFLVTLTETSESQHKMLEQGEDERAKRVRLIMSDETEGLLHVDVIHNDSHYSFYPIPVPGTALSPDMDNLVENPSPVIAEVVNVTSQEKVADEVKENQKLFRKEDEKSVTTSTNIDTRNSRRRVKSSPSAHGNSLNQNHRSFISSRETPSRLSRLVGSPGTSPYGSSGEVRTLPARAVLGNGATDDDSNNNDDDDKSAEEERNFKEEDYDALPASGSDSSSSEEELENETSEEDEAQVNNSVNSSQLECPCLSKDWAKNNSTVNDTSPTKGTSNTTANSTSTRFGKESEPGSFAWMNRYFPFQLSNMLNSIMKQIRENVTRNVKSSGQFYPSPLSQTGQMPIMHYTSPIIPHHPIHPGYSSFPEYSAGIPGIPGQMMRIPQYPANSPVQSSFQQQQYPFMPGQSNIPQQYPGQSSYPQSPFFPGLGQLRIPQYPGIPGQSNYPLYPLVPGQSGFPQYPLIPGQSSFSQYPSVPGQSSVPQYPLIPGQSSFPQSYPSIPGQSTLPLSQNLFIPGQTRPLQYQVTPGLSNNISEYSNVSEPSNILSVPEVSNISQESTQSLPGQSNTTFQSPIITQSVSNTHLLPIPMSNDVSEYPLVVPGQYNVSDYTLIAPGQLIAPRQSNVSDYPLIAPGQSHVSEYPLVVAEHSNVSQYPLLVTGQSNVSQYPLIVPEQPNVSQHPLIVPGQFNVSQYPLVFPGQSNISEYPSIVPGQSHISQYPLIVPRQSNVSQYPLVVPGQSNIQYQVLPGQTSAEIPQIIPPPQLPPQPQPTFTKYVLGSPQSKILRTVLPSSTSYGIVTTGWDEHHPVVLEIENVTCIVAPAMKLKKIALRRHYGQNRTKCPSQIPCREFKSCSMWQAGFVGDDFTLSQLIYKAYLKDLFDVLPVPRVQQILNHFEKCHNATRVPAKIAESTHECPALVKHYKYCLHSSQYMGLCKPRTVSTTRTTTS